MNSLCDEHNLRAFAEGQLPEDESQKIMELFLADDDCLQAMDHIWANQKDMEMKIPPMDPEIAKRLESQILTRIRRSNMGGNAVRLGTEGLMKALLALIQPFIGPSRNRPAPGNGD